jgi:hypothetical protein
MGTVFSEMSCPNTLLAVHNNKTSDNKPRFMVVQVGWQTPELAYDAHPIGQPETRPYSPQFGRSRSNDLA